MKIRLAQTVEKIITTSIRATESERKLHRKAAKKRGMSFNTWAVLALNAAAARDLKTITSTQENNGTSSK